MFLRLLIFTFVLTAMNVFAQAPTIETGVSQTLAKWRAANYSDVRYKLNLTLEKMSPTLKGTIEIRVKLSEPPASAGGSNSQAIILDWRKIRGKEELSTVSNVSVNNKPVILAANPPDDAGGSDNAAKFEEINEHLVFKDGVIKGENVVKLDFTSPILTSGGAITRYVDKEDGAEYVYSLFVPSDASTAFPVFDQPDLKARFQLGIRPPRNWKVVSNLSVSVISRMCPMDSGFYDFEETKPISTYVFAFAAGEFAEFTETGGPPGLIKSDKNNIFIVPRPRPNDGFLLRQFDDSVNSHIYVRKSQAEKFKQHAAETFRLNREAVKYLESYFDYKFPFPKYDLVLIPEFPFGGMEHAGATFLREDRVIFPTEPTKNDFVTRANLIFHEAAHQWFGDTVTMRWFDDLWLKEGFAEFMAYKTLEKVMPEYNSWKIFYERNKQAAYLTDSTKGTTPIYQEIPNLSAAKSAYGNIVYRKAPSFLKQAEFYLGADKFQTAVRAFLKKHQFANAEWTDLVKEFETASEKDLKDWANVWVKEKGIFTTRFVTPTSSDGNTFNIIPTFVHSFSVYVAPVTKFKVLVLLESGQKIIREISLGDKYKRSYITGFMRKDTLDYKLDTAYVFPNYQDYGYGIFLLDEKSRDYVQKNIQNEKDDFLRTMMWGSLWDSVREAELAPKDYLELVIKNIDVETDESTIQTLLGRVATAMSYYLSDAQRIEVAPRLEMALARKIKNAATPGQKITFYRAYLNIASTQDAAQFLKVILRNSSGVGKKYLNGKEVVILPVTPLFDSMLPLQTKDKFDIVTRLLILGDKDALNLLAELEKTETSDEAKRYGYAARSGIGTAENKAKFWNDFVGNKEISENWIEAAFVSFNSARHAELTLPYLEKALAELPNLKRSRKIFFVNGWLAAFTGGQRSEQALAVVNKFLTDNPNLDKDLRLKILENSDNLERAVKIRKKFEN